MTVTYDYKHESNKSADPHVCETEQLRPVLLGTMERLAPLVWENDFDLLFKLEQLALEQNYGLMTGAFMLKSLAGKSTYAERPDKQRLSDEARMKLDGERSFSMAVQALRQANQQRHSFSVLVRSVSALSKRTPTIQWRRQCRLRALVDKKTANSFLKMVMQADSCTRLIYIACYHMPS